MITKFYTNFEVSLKKGCAIIFFMKVSEGNKRSMKYIASCIKKIILLMLNACKHSSVTSVKSAMASGNTITF